MTAIVWCPYCMRQMTSHAAHGQMEQHLVPWSGDICPGIGLVGLTGLGVR